MEQLGKKHATGGKDLNVNRDHPLVAMTVATKMLKINTNVFR